MTEKHKPKEPDKSQKERFKEAAKAVGADESESALDKAFGKIDTKIKSRSKP